MSHSRRTPHWLTNSWFHLKRIRTSSVRSASWTNYKPPLLMSHVSGTIESLYIAWVISAKCKQLWHMSTRTRPSIREYTGLVQRPKLPCCLDLRQSQRSQAMHIKPKFWIHRSWRHGSWAGCKQKIIGSSLLTTSILSSKWKDISQWETSTNIRWLQREIQMRMEFQRVVWKCRCWLTRMQWRCSPICQTSL